MRQVAHDGVLVTEKGKTGTVVARDSSYNMVVLGEDLPLGTTIEAEIFGAGTTYMIGSVSKQRLSRLNLILLGDKGGCECQNRLIFI